MTSPYQMFKTDASLEEAGIKLNYGSFHFVIARAGGSNKKYFRVVKAKTKPYEARIRTNNLDAETADRIFMEIFAESVVRGWGSEEFGEGKIPGPDGDPLEFNYENCLKLFKELPDLFYEIKTVAENSSIFKSEELGDDSKNLLQCSNMNLSTEQKKTES